MLLTLTQKAMEVLDSIPIAHRCVVGQIHLSKLYGKTKLKPHCGGSNLRLTAHLPLVTQPDSGIILVCVVLYGTSSTCNSTRLRYHTCMCCIIIWHCIVFYFVLNCILLHCTASCLGISELHDTGLEVVGQHVNCTRIVL